MASIRLSTHVLSSIFAMAGFFTIAGVFDTTEAKAITIDAFENEGFLTSTSAVGTTQRTHIPSTSAVGGGRKLEATKSSTGHGSTDIEIMQGNSLGYSQGPHAGKGAVVWDGDTNASTIKPNGLGTLDLEQDGGTAFILGLQYFDYPANQSLTVSVRLYDASTPDGSKYSDVSVVINQFWMGPGTFPITVPFSTFATAGKSSVPAPRGLTFETTTVFGPGGVVNINRVGAISLAFRGQAPDLVLAPFTTNGRCSSVPNSSGLVVDECSVCLDSTNANKGSDRCGTCLFGPPGYSYKAAKVVDGCGLCPAEQHYKKPRGNKDPCGSCLGGPPPYSYVDTRDVCGVCGGKTTDKEKCQTLNQGCNLSKPTNKILGFEKSLVQKASLLKKRFKADLARSKRNNCQIDFDASQARVTQAFNLITAQASRIFSKGVEVCKGSCVTVSYANEVKALRPQFDILEKESNTAAKKVYKCYRDLKIPRSPNPAGGSNRGVANDVRAGLDQLIRECSRTKVCR